MSRFHDAASENIYNGKETTAQRKLTAVLVAATVGDLGFPPGNKLEALSGDRNGQYSIRINERYRICFTWTDQGATRIEIVDYH